MILRDEDQSHQRDYKPFFTRGCRCGMSSDTGSLQELKCSSFLQIPNWERDLPRNKPEMRKREMLSNHRYRSRRPLANIDLTCISYATGAQYPQLPLVSKEKCSPNDIICRVCGTQPATNTHRSSLAPRRTLHALRPDSGPLLHP